MFIQPKSGILLIKKYKKSHIKVDMVVEETEEDKRLITGEVISEGDSDYHKGLTIIFGKYALFPLTLQGEDYYFLDKNDVIGITSFKEQ